MANDKGQRTKLSQLRVAIVCDWLTGIGGAERVVLEVHKMFPDAPIYTSQYDPKKLNWFREADVRTTWLQRLPKGLKKFLPVLRAWSFSRLDLRQYDLVISITGAEAKFVHRLKPGAVHVCYCNSPTHYYWSRYEYYLEHPGFGRFDWLARIGLKTLVGPMRRWDYRAAQRPHHMIGNSTHIRDRIKDYYGREAMVVHPPVDIGRFSGLKSVTRSGFVITGRQVPYKRIDLAVAACTRLSLPLTVIGDGPEHQRLQLMAGPTVKFVTGASDQDVAELLAGAEAFIFPGIDDFGIAPVEAMAAGTPVIAFRGGGALDYVRPGKSGEFFDEQTVESLAGALEHFDSGNYHVNDIKSVAAEFSAENFQKNLHTAIARILQ